jgi:hypothetical protein
VRGSIFRTSEMESYINLLQICKIRHLLKATPSVPIYNSFDFLLSLTDLSYSFFIKNEKFKIILKIYYMLNDIILKINNNYDFFNKTRLKKPNEVHPGPDPKSLRAAACAPIGHVWLIWLVGYHRTSRSQKSKKDDTTSLPQPCCPARRSVSGSGTTRAC